MLSDTVQPFLLPKAISNSTFSDIYGNPAVWVVVAVVI